MVDFDKDSSLFGIFDGHGGPIISKFSACNFSSIFNEYYSENKDKGVENSLIQTFIKLDELLIDSEVNTFLKKQIYLNNSDYNFNLKSYVKLNSNINNKIKGSFITNSMSFNSNESTGLNFDNTNNNKLNSQDSKEDSESKLKSFKFKKDNDLIANSMGTTANLIYIENNNLYVANVGDSYSVMFKNGKAIKLNSEHKTCLDSENERILKAGFKVVNSRVDGKLNLTRAIGK
jgi:protein phosphatase 1G